jgi:hypothetical protein
VLVEENVWWLEVAMEDAVRVQVVEGADEVVRELLGSLFAE